MAKNNKRYSKDSILDRKSRYRNDVVIYYYGLSKNILTCIDKNILKNECPEPIELFSQYEKRNHFELN